MRRLPTVLVFRENIVRNYVFHKHGSLFLFIGLQIIFVSFWWVAVWEKIKKMAAEISEKFWQNTIIFFFFLKLYFFFFFTLLIYCYLEIACQKKFSDKFVKLRIKNICPNHNSL